MNQKTLGVSFLFAFLFAAAPLLGFGAELPAPPVPSVEKMSRLPRLDASLAGFAGGQLAEADLRVKGYRWFDDRVQVVIEVEGDSVKPVVESVRDLGGQQMSSARNSVQAEVPADAIISITEIPGVSFVRKPIYAQYPDTDLPSPAKTLAANQVSEGVAAMNAPAWHAAGFTGEGIRVGVIDSGFGGYQGLMGSDLPPGGRTHYRSFGSSWLDSRDVHGTACAEIIHDIAPDAEIFLAHISSGVDFDNAVDWLAANGVSVISHSMGWFFPGPGDGTGWIQTEIREEVQSNDTLWFNSAGNSREEHWYGPSTDADDDGWVDQSDNQSGGNTFRTSSGSYKQFEYGDTITVYLKWNDWNQPSSDFDVFLYRWDEENEEWVLEDESTDRQDGYGNDRSIEVIDHYVTKSGRYAYGIGRYDVSGQYDLETFTSDYLTFGRTHSSLTQPADSPDVVAVAAGDFEGSFGDHSYSSMGPADGPGGSLNGGLDKPDITGYAGVRTVSYSSAFYGTSAACPHAAGAAALVRGAYPNWSHGDVRSYLESNAEDRGPAGKDPRFGFGRLLLGDPPDGTGGGGGGGASTCGNAQYDSGTSEGATWFNGGMAGDPQYMFAVKFDLQDFGYQPGNVELAAFCAGNEIDFGGPWPNEVFVYPDNGGKPNDSVVLAHGTIRTGDGTGPYEVVLANPVTLNGDFWLVNRGYAAHSGEDFNMEFDDQPNSGHGYVSSSGIGGLALSDGGNDNFILRATLQQKSGGGGGGGSSGSYAYLVSGVAHLSGVGGGEWRTHLGILNRSGKGANIELRYNYGSKTISRSLEIANETLLTWDDVAVSLFGVGGKSSGSILITSSRELVVTTRTYNQTPAGTFGSFLPGTSAGEGLSYGQIGSLSHLCSNSDFRTNVGFVNFGEDSCTVDVRLKAANGSAIGNLKRIYLNAHGWKQVNDIFGATGAGSRNSAYATVEVKTPGCEVWGYGAVIDNNTNDATTIPISSGGK